jgi:hypothetical protein
VCKLYFQENRAEHVADDGVGDNEQGCELTRFVVIDTFCDRLMANG